MGFFSSSSGLPLKEALEHAYEHLDGAGKENRSQKRSIQCCKEAKAMIVDAGKVFNKAKDQAQRTDIGKAYFDHGTILQGLKQTDKAQRSFKKAKKWGYVANPSQSSNVNTSRPSGVAGSPRPGNMIGMNRESSAGPVDLAGISSISAATYQDIKSTNTPQIISNDSIKSSTPNGVKDIALEANAANAAKSEAPVAKKAQNQVPASKESKSQAQAGTATNKEQATKAGTYTEPVELKFFNNLNTGVPKVEYELPPLMSRIEKTQDLVYCLSLLNGKLKKEDPDSGDNTKESTWINDIKPDEIARLKATATQLLRVFIQEDLKKTEEVNEVVSLAVVLEKDDARELLQTFVDGLSKSVLLDHHLANGLAQFMKNSIFADFDSDDLVKILALLHNKLEGTHGQSVTHLYQLAQAISRVLDSMVDCQVSGLSREQLHDPLTQLLKGLKGDSDPSMIYEAAYAFQAMLLVPNDESKMGAVLRRTGLVVQGVSGLVSAVKAFDVVEFAGSLQSIGKGVSGALDGIGALTGMYKNVVDLVDSGQGFLEALKESFNFDKKSDWYRALRDLDSLVQVGKFADFETLIRKLPPLCQRNPAFQWGLCQRLGEIASNSTWNAEIRKGAISFMGEMYGDAMWNQHVSVRLWTLHILESLAGNDEPSSDKTSSDKASSDKASSDKASSDKDVAKYAQNQLEALKAHSTPETETQFQAYEKDHQNMNPFRPDLKSKASPLLTKYLNKPDIEGPLQRMKATRLEVQKNQEKQGVEIYVSPKARQAKSVEIFELTPRVEKFLENDKKVFLLLGESGAGKSTFFKELEVNLWNKYNKYDKFNGRIPLLIYLPAIDSPHNDLVGKQLGRMGFNDAQVKELKDTREFTLICDGYDESQQTRNLYTSNNLNVPGGWRAKMLISCRTDSIGADYKDIFQPTDRNDTGGKPELFEEATIATFDDDQIQRYIEQYVKPERTKWSVHKYSKALKQIPSLRDLVKNPFLLKLTLEYLPAAANSSWFSDSEIRITSVELYDNFIDQWLERSKVNLMEMGLKGGTQDEFRNLGQSGFKKSGITFLKDLANAMYTNQPNNPIVTYTPKDTKSWKEEFFGSIAGKKLLREALPLICSHTQSQFIHRSILDYGVALAIFDPEENKETEEEVTPTQARRGSVVSTMSFEDFHKEKEETIPLEQPLLDSPLGKRSIIAELAVIQFLAERAQKYPKFRERLRAIIECSKKKEENNVRVAAANAITILVRASVDFNGEDLRGINIPGADLSFGVFDSTNLEGADLRKVNLRNVWLRKAKLDGANMQSVQFGEFPYLEPKSGVRCSTYSPDGKSYSVGLENGNAKVYETETWKKRDTLPGTGKVNCLAYSGKSDRIVTGSTDGTVRLWDVENGGRICDFIGHTGKVACIAYAPKEERFVTGGQDGSVRLWDAATGKIVYILTETEHKAPITSVAYSRYGDQIAAATKESTVFLWEAETGKLAHALKGHTDSVNTISYSPKKNEIVSGGSDKLVLLWNSTTGDCIHKFEGHADEVTKVLFSPAGDEIASGGLDKTVRLWNIKNGICAHTLVNSDEITDIKYSPQSGGRIASSSKDSIVRVWDAGTGSIFHVFEVNDGNITSIAYSPKGYFLTAGCMGESVRLWDIKTLAYVHTYHGHTDDVNKVICLSKKDNENEKDLVATGGDDKTVRLWDIKTGVCVQTLDGHKAQVTELVYSPKENQIASGSNDGTVRLWELNDGKSATLTFTLECGQNKVVSIAYSPDGDKIVSGYEDKTVHLWDVKTGKPIHNFPDHTSEVNSVAFSPKGNQVASGSNDKTVRLWEVESGKCLHVLKGHSDSVTSVVYAPKGNQVASGSNDNTVKLWDMETGKLVHTLSEHTKRISSVAYSPPGGRIATGSDDNTVKVWDISNGTCIQTLAGHDKKISCVVFSSKGDRIATGSDDWTVRVWSAQTWKELVTIAGFNAIVNDLAWKESDDGLFLVTGSDDKSVRSWKIVKESAEKYKADLCWSSSHEVLTVSGASFKDVRNLESVHNSLLKQGNALVPPTSSRE